MSVYVCSREFSDKN